MIISHSKMLIYLQDQNVIKAVPAWHVYFEKIKSLKARPNCKKCDLPSDAVKEGIDGVNILKSATQEQILAFKKYLGVPTIHVMESQPGQTPKATPL